MQEPMILALDTATACCSVAVTAGTPVEGRVIASVSLNGSTTHSRRLLSAIEWLLAETEVTWPMIAGVAVGLGPGSFTGLRIGMATAKGLAATAGVPLLGIPTLDALAGSCRTARLICAALDARKKEVYIGFYRCDAQGIARRVSPIRAINPMQLAAEIAEPVLIVGDGVQIYGERWRQALGERAAFAPAPLHIPSAAAIGLQGALDLAEGRELDLASAVPLYIRASDAELSLDARRQAGARA